MKKVVKTVIEIRANKRKFQLGILDMKIEQEAELSPDETFFMDRAIPDAMAYYQFLKLEYDKILLNAMAHVSYKNIFILDRLRIVNDYARIEDEHAQIKIHKLIIDIYKSLNFPVVFVPVLSPDERIYFILKNIKLQ